MRVSASLHITCVPILMRFLKEIGSARLMLWYVTEILLCVPGVWSLTREDTQNRALNLISHAQVPAHAWQGIHGPRAFDGNRKLTQVRMAKPRAYSPGVFPCKQVPASFHAVLNWKVALGLRAQAIRAVLQLLYSASRLISGLFLKRRSPCKQRNGARELEKCFRFPRPNAARLDSHNLHFQLLCSQTL